MTEDKPLSALDEVRRLVHNTPLCEEERNAIMDAVLRMGVQIQMRADQELAEKVGEFITGLHRTKREHMIANGFRAPSITRITNQVNNGEA